MQKIVFGEQGLKTGKERSCDAQSKLRSECKYDVQAMALLVEHCVSCKRLGIRYGGAREGG